MDQMQSNVKSGPKLVLEFEQMPLRVWRLVRTFFDPQDAIPNFSGSVPCRTTNKGCKRIANEKTLKWEEDHDPKGIKAFALVFVRCRRYVEQGIKPGANWTILRGPNGSPAATMAGVIASNSAINYTWISDFCGYTGTSGHFRCSLANYFRAKNYRPGDEEATAQIEFDAIAFPVENISIEICTADGPRNAGSVELMCIEKYLVGMKDWKKQDEIEIPPPPEEKRLSPGFVGRDKDLETVDKMLLAADAGEDDPVIVLGTPGVGKTTLAKIIAKRESTIQRFGQRILFTSLGIRPAIFSALSEWNEHLRGAPLDRSLPLDALHRIVSGRVGQASILYIIDDVWEPQHAKFLMLQGVRSRTLLTTRKPFVADQLTKLNHRHQLKGLTTEDSLKILEDISGGIIPELADQYKQLAWAVQGLPLALQVAGRMIRREKRRQNSPSAILERLMNLAALLKEPAPDVIVKGMQEETDNPTVANILLQSVNQLSNAAQRCFAGLRFVDPAPATFSVDYVAKMWPESDSGALLDELDLAGLIEPMENGLFQIHPLLVALAATL
jgi:hypothetical protein